MASLSRHSSYYDSASMIRELLDLLLVRLGKLVAFIPRCTRYECRRRCNLWRSVVSQLTEHEELP
ncbi:hypothetical protein TSUD_101700 [Trifolium subterraneum]|uniref:Uncharacterized protein n=1 Tax=Trifolium subterraneum TaxID=3900 RepID=A0A2Z6NAN7_TRISU|nr:hypothetical protein TSUD_101700 [Trifolium subterraneum]